jgi:F-type H+-transporting ATPase subunit b
VQLWRESVDLPTVFFLLSCSIVLSQRTGPVCAGLAGCPQFWSRRKERAAGHRRHGTGIKLLASWLHLDKEAAARLFEYLNFAIVAGAILFALMKYLPKTFRANREDIQHRLVDARTATEQANERLAAIEQRLSRLGEEIAAIGKQAEKDSFEDEARIKASIETERQRIIEAVTRDIAAASGAAQRDLKRFAAGLAVDRAAQRIALTHDDDRALVQEFSQSLGKQARNGDKN